MQFIDLKKYKSINIVFLLNKMQTPSKAYPVRIRSSALDVFQNLMEACSSKYTFLLKFSRKSDRFLIGLSKDMSQLSPNLISCNVKESFKTP